MRMINILVLLTTISLAFAKPELKVLVRLTETQFREKFGEEAYREAVERERRFGREMLATAMAVSRAAPYMIAASWEPSV